MSRMYDNKPLTNLPLHSVKWKGQWNHSDWKHSMEKPGVLLEGKVISQARISISNSEERAVSDKTRYFILFLRIEKAHKRKFDATGKEQEPNFSETTKVSTGFLNSSYDVRQKGSSDRLSVDEVKSLTQNPQINAMLNDVLSKDSSGDIYFLLKEEERDKIEILNETFVRIKTAGNSPLIESLVLCDTVTAAKGNFVGDEKMGDNWTDKIMKMKSTSNEQQESKESEVADEEWDD
ncbi:arpin-like [Physella acuta]|uniref:arpin-like n=1 Tax=Physella acuta TaxID=109671 RepID=UPI0027DD9F32|nr:arpin-like [Physella acuta]XP_059161118.1 arpin-like [Physella acuta]XP_059161119.1 arpin-like [Physella acuta]XP_059161120.1 arpin-like [Physella acuta]XP_059161121.1 arpin-like [Physella acuta]